MEIINCENIENERKEQIVEKMNKKEDRTEIQNTKNREEKQGKTEILA